jgi:hypothetical protein
VITGELKSWGDRESSGSDGTVASRRIDGIAIALVFRSLESASGASVKRR